MTMISQCLEAAGIKQVVWIDDYFAPPSREEMAHSIEAHIMAARSEQKLAVELEYFNAIDLVQGVSAIEDAIDQTIENMTDEALMRVIERIPTVNHDTVLDDLAPQDFTGLLSAFGNQVKKYSLGTWTTTGVEEILPTADETLFLIDKEFEREKGKGDGIQVLGEILSRKKGICIMLTHTCTENDQEQTRIDLAASLKVPSHQFCVLSKRQTGSLEIDPKFACAIRTAMTHRFNGAIAAEIAAAIEQSARETAVKLSQQSVSDLEQAIFENSWSEGVPEYDAVIRVFNVQQRSALQIALQNESIQSQVRASRKFREKTNSLKLPKTNPNMEFFRGWRRREVYQDGGVLNKMHTPLSCGDIFQDDVEKRYILLAPPCDLMVRGKNGERRIEAALLVAVTEKIVKAQESREESESKHRFYELDDIFEPGKKWRVDFQKVMVIDLSILDFCVFNADGVIQLRRDQPKPLIALTPGWAKRLNRAACKLFPKNKEKTPTPPKLGLGKLADRLMAKSDADAHAFPIRRIGRIESSLATGALAAWSTFQTRAALDHDFSKIKDETPNPPEDQKGNPE